MSLILLKTKLHKPRWREGLVCRPILLQRLNEGLRAGKPFTLISAPAGYGKTTLVCEWLAQLHQPQAWLSLDEHDNDPYRFMSYLISALQTCIPDIGSDTFNMLSTAGSMLPVQAALINLINEMMTVHQTIVLILDDYHLITNDVIHKMVQTILDHHLVTLHLVMITREDPALALPRLRVRGQMTEMRVADLRFDSREINEFLMSSLGIPLDDEEVATLDLRTEGWIASLQLLSLSVKGWTQAQVAQFVRDFSGSYRYIIDYLMEEVVSRIDPDVKRFIAHTAAVERFSAELGDYLLGQMHSKYIIRQLEQANLFLIPLDNERQWYRYHHLFSQFMRSELPMAEKRETWRKASEWFSDRGLCEEAIEYALSAEVVESAVSLVKLQAAQVFQRGQMVMLLDWLTALGAEQVEKDADLLSFKAWSLFLLGKSEEAMYCLQTARWASIDSDSSLAEGRLLALQGWVANYRDDPKTSEIALAAIRLLGHQDPFFAEIALISLGHAQRRNEHMAESTTTLRKAHDTAKDSGHDFTCLTALLDIAMNLVIEGKRREGMELCQSSLRLHVDRAGNPLSMAELLYIPLGIFEYEGNNLASARLYLQRGIRVSHELELNRILGGDAEQTLALVNSALGDGRVAQESLETAKTNIDARAFPVIRERYEAFLAHLALREGDLVKATAWAESSGISVEAGVTSLKEIPLLVMARTFYRARRYEEAWAILRCIREFDLARGRYGRLVYADVVSSLVLLALGRREEATEIMEEALSFAAVEGYVRPFLGEGSEVKTLLRVVTRNGFSEHVSALLDHPSESGDVPSSPTVDFKGLVEPLSDRELEVLRLLASGLSNDEIGNRLYISLGTVKWHVKNVFGKLLVKSRTQAVARARQLGLI